MIMKDYKEIFWGDFIPQNEPERIILALMRGNHLSDKELEIAKQKVHAMNVELKNRK